MNFSGKTALITGAGSGIGKAIAMFLAEHGADIVVNDISARDGAAAVEEIETLGRRALASGANVAMLDEVREMFEQVKVTFRRVDILVNNAGITRDGFLLKMTEADWDQVIDVNLKGVFNCCKYGGAMMADQQYGKIINIASASAQIGNIGQANYAASKGGVISLTKTLAKELARYNINVNGVAPGFIETPMTQAVPDKVREYLVKQIPLARAGRPEDIAHAVAFLASEMSSYITGQIVSCNGGMYV